LAGLFMLKMVGIKSWEESMIGFCQLKLARGLRSQCFSATRRHPLPRVRAAVISGPSPVANAAPKKLVLALQAVDHL
jgi:hypothetical protein